jgi:hypothetical protein
MITKESLITLGSRLAEHAMSFAEHNHEIKWVRNWADNNLLLDEVDTNVLLNSAQETLDKAKYGSEI